MALLLRERPEDIPPLLDHFTRFYAKQYRGEPSVASPSLRSVLVAYPWPGNAAELAAWVERLYATGLARRLGLDQQHLDEHRRIESGGVQPLDPRR